jgi:hypothetical protein
MPAPSKAARDLAAARLADETTGFNAKLADVAEAYSMAPFEIDFSEESDNFFVGQVSPEDIADTTEYSPPLIGIYTERSFGPPKQKGRSWSGEVWVRVTVVGEWEQDRANVNFEAWADMVEDAMVSVFDMQKPLDGNGAQWMGQMDMDRGAVVKAGANWRQAMNFLLRFQVHQ